VQDARRRAEALEEAEKRLRSSIQFKRGDVAPLLALGEVLSLRVRPPSLSPLIRCMSSPISGEWEGFEGRKRHSPCQ
jgi:hypothetical protein